MDKFWENYITTRPVNSEGAFDAFKKMNQEPRSTIQGPRNMADGGEVIGKPGGLVEEGVEYYSQKIYKVTVGSHKGDWVLAEPTYNPATKTKSTKNRYFKNKTELNNYLKETKTPPKYSKTELNKAAQHFFNKNYNEIDSKQQAKAYQRIRSGEGKFSKVTQADPLTTIQQAKILREYPDAKFTAKNKFGFPPGHSNYQKVTAFVSRDYKRPFQKTQLQALPKYAQQELIEAFPEVKFNFDRDTLIRKGSQVSKYGIPVTHSKYSKIAKYFAKTRPWKYNFDLRSPEGWMMSQMERNYAQNGDASPYRPITKKGGPIAKDNPMIGIEHNGKKYNMKTIVNHADFDNTKKYWNIADKTSKKYLSEFDNLAKLLPEGFDPKKIQVNDLLQFIGDKDGIKGLNRAKRTIQIHHEYGVGPRATTNYQLLRQDMNLLANKANNLIKSGKLSNIEEGAAKALERNTRLVVNDVRYGPKKVSATGDIKTIISQAETEMKGLTKKDWNKFGNLFRQLCPKGKASGGRIGFATGTATVSCGMDQLDKYLKNGVPKEQRTLVARILGTGKGMLKGLNPVEMFKLKNWVSPQAMAAMGLFETAFVADDVLRKGKPLNEAVAGNWFTNIGGFLDEEAEKAKNILGSNKYQLSPAAQEYAQSLVDINEYNNLDNYEKVYGLAGATHTITPEIREKVESDKKILYDKIMKTPTTGQLDYENISGEKEATWKGKAEDAPFFGYDSFTSGQTKKQFVPGEYVQKKGQLPESKTIDVPAYVSENYKTSNITEQDVLNMYKDEGWISPTDYKSGMKLDPGGLTWWRMQDPGRGTYGTQEKFMGGGMVGIRKPGAIAPTGGPMHQGLRSLYIDDMDY